ncbi:hypothetical protein J8M20_02440 [Pseudoalteromonas luteoviolacea]|uniref:hypothetical protein n=1 Tax=Pseudoalteromonas luteoviolacea TaxID=43657 RepID=UPI001B36AB19|nr:hypothetical protein [Pseudoalteromonas luteoviolacea]MBQ4810171.1 hypothetical protein [Pseudoalteromonas luteoviolacea]
MYDGAVFTGVAKNGAEKSLDYVKDATLCLADMQTSILTTLAFLTQNGRKVHALSGPATIVLIGATLLCAAWIIKGLPSVAIRVEMTKPIFLANPLSVQSLQNFYDFTVSLIDVCREFDD